MQNIALHKTANYLYILINFLARPAGIEPATLGLEVPGLGFLNFFKSTTY